MRNSKNYSPKEFSTITGVKLRKIYVDLSQGLIPHYRVGKIILIPESSKNIYLGPLLGEQKSHEQEGWK